MNRKRRRFCQLSGGLLLASAVLPTAGCNGGGSMGVLAGTTDDVPKGQTLFGNTTGYNFNVCHDADGYYAVDANCTHANCVVFFGDQANPNGFTCPCHQSTFDYNGQNPTGPAATKGPLKHYKVTISGNQIYVDPTTEVDISVRVM
jgi:Rieske Fe-S protein